jgi:serine protease
MTLRRRTTAALAAAAAACAIVPAGAAAAEYVPGEVVVKREGQAPEVVDVRSVPKALRALRRSDRVEYAAPNPIARAAAVREFVPNDPGFGEGWRAVQWNFLAEEGVNAPVAWQQAIDAGAPGGRGVRVAVLDSGVAYSDRGRFRKSPDLGETRFSQGYDFVDRDAFPHDENGHGTHVASTIAESTNNGRGLTGLPTAPRSSPSACSTATARATPPASPTRCAGRSARTSTSSTSASSSAPRSALARSRRCSTRCPSRGAAASS